MPNDHLRKRGENGAAPFHSGTCPKKSRRPTTCELIAHVRPPQSSTGWIADSRPTRTTTVAGLSQLPTTNAAADIRRSRSTVVMVITSASSGSARIQATHQRFAGPASPASRIADESVPGRSNTTIAETR